MLRVLHLTLSLAPGGRRQAIFNVARGAPMRERVESHFATLGNGDKTPPEAGDLAASVTHLKRSSLFDRRAVAVLRELLDTRKIDLIHAHDAASQLTASMAVLGSARPLVLTFHRSKDVDSKPWRIRLLCAPANLRTAAIITPSAERATHYRRYHFLTGNRIQVIHHGIDTTRFRPDPERRGQLRRELGMSESSFVAGAIGHFGEEKGIDLTIDALAAANQRLGDAPAQLLVLGTGDPVQIDALKQRAADRGVAEQVHFLGFRSDPERMLSAVDVFLHGARLEAFGLVLIEALAAGCPVIATRTGGASDILQADCGTLVEIDDAGAMADATVALAQDPKYRAEQASNARQRALQQFSIERCCQEHLTLYQRLAAAAV